MTEARISWIDVAKGICIILVVLMHADETWLALTGREGWLGAAVDFAQPFRMPAFFMVSGLFLARSINAPLLDYLDRKGIHFLYFYLLWLAIHLTAFESSTLRDNPEAFAQILIGALTTHPYQTLWFVHMLAIFFIVCRILRRAPKLAVLAGAVALQTSFAAGYTLDSLLYVEFAKWFVFFYLGNIASPYILGFVQHAVRLWPITLAALAAWALINFAATSQGLGTAPLFSLLLGVLGAAAVFSFSALLARVRLDGALAYAGAHSIVIYLTEMIAARVVQKIWLAIGEPADIGWAALITACFAVLASLAFHRLIKNSPLNFLYVRPQWLRPTARPRPAEAP